MANVEDRLISAIELQGIDTEGSNTDDHYRVKQQRVLNLIQATVGEPYDEKIVEGDVHILTHLGEFDYISADVVLQEDGTVHLIYTFREQQIITQVSVVGNHTVSDAELLFAVPIMEGLGRDEDAIDRGRRAIMDLYKEKGNYLVEVFSEIVVYGSSKDEVTGEIIEESVVLIYRVMEGPRVRVGGVAFHGNHSFAADVLASEIDTHVAIPFFRRGELNEEVLDADVGALKRFYTMRGFRDIRISYTDPLSPNDKEASVLFLIEEGPQYTVGGISAEFHTIGSLEPVFSVEQIRGLVPIKVGDVYRQIDIRDAIQSINNAYGVLGRIIDIEPRQKAITRARQNMYGGGSSLEQDVAAAVPYHAEPGTAVDIVFVITEGLPTKVGLIEIKGNTVTKDKVIRGRIGLKPGNPFNSQEAKQSEFRLMKTRLFNKVTMTIQPENIETPGFRDLLVEVDESQTGSLTFGVMAGSDAGVLGSISLTQRNFDVADWPESWEEFWQRKSFLGAGQQFNMAIQPGQEVFNYELGLKDSRFLDTDYSVGGSFNIQKREYEDYTQETDSSRFQIGRRFGDIWLGSVSLSSERIELAEITDDVPQEVFDNRGPITMNSIGINVSRTTLSPIASPTTGTRISFNIENYGLGSG
ncbi:MAG: POTRA domain-containing protein, partial [Planctomycetota bacterium]|nr:POTRA domain-containing protein [Planctomycetota bacterium]